MKIENKEYKTIWFDEAYQLVRIIDQTKLPHQFIIKDLSTVKDAINAIKTMEVRGAPLIGGTAAYGIVLAIKFLIITFAFSALPNRTLITC